MGFKKDSSFFKYDPRALNDLKGQDYTGRERMFDNLLSDNAYFRNNDNDDY